MNREQVDKLFEEIEAKLPDPNTYEKDWCSFLVHPNSASDILTGEASSQYLVSFKKMPAKGGYIWEPDFENTGWER